MPKQKEEQFFMPETACPTCGTTFNAQGVCPECPPTDDMIGGEKTRRTTDEEKQEEPS